MAWSPLSLPLTCPLTVWLNRWKLFFWLRLKRLGWYGYVGLISLTIPTNVQNLLHLGLPLLVRLLGMFSGELPAHLVAPLRGLRLRLGNLGLCVLRLGLSLQLSYLTCLSINLSNFGPLFSKRPILRALSPLQSLLNIVGAYFTRALQLRRSVRNLIVENLRVLRLRRLSGCFNTSLGLLPLKVLVRCLHNL